MVVGQSDGMDRSIERTCWLTRRHGHGYAHQTHTAQHTQANVMLEYPYEEAIGVLETSLSNAKERLVRGCGRVCRAHGCVARWRRGCGHVHARTRALHCLGGHPNLVFCFSCVSSPAHIAQRTTNEDLTHLKNQTITVEVNMARLFNWNVQKQKKLGAVPGGGGAKRPVFQEKEIA